MSAGPVTQRLSASLTWTLYIVPAGKQDDNESYQPLKVNQVKSNGIA